MSGVTVCNGYVPIPALAQTRGMGTAKTNGLSPLRHIGFVQVERNYRDWRAIGMSLMQSVTRILKASTRAAVLVLISTCVTWAAATDVTEPTGSVSIVQDGTLMNANVNGEPLRKVLAHLKSQSQIQAHIELYIVAETELDTAVYAEYSRVPLIQGLKSLLKGVDYLMTYTIPKAEATAIASKSGIRVFLPDKGEILIGPATDRTKTPVSPVAADVALSESSLVDALGHADPEIRRKALRSMATMFLDGTLAIALDPIATIARGDNSSELRREALTLLGKTIGDAGYTPDNAQILGDTLAAAMQDGDATVRGTAIEVLSGLPMEDASEAPAPMRIAAERERLLVSMIESEADPRLRERALNALSDVANDVGEYEQYVRALERAISDTDSGVQKSAFSLLGDQDLPEEHVQRLIPALSSLASSSAASGLRLDALEAIRVLHSDTGRYEGEFVSALDGAIATGDPQLRISAVDMLMEMDTSDAAAELITKTALTNSVPGLRLRALDAVTKLEINQARDVLAKAAKDPDSKVSERAQEILQTLNPQ